MADVMFQKTGKLPAHTFIIRVMLYCDVTFLQVSLNWRNQRVVAGKDFAEYVRESEQALRGAKKAVHEHHDFFLASQHPHKSICYQS